MPTDIRKGAVFVDWLKAGDNSPLSADPNAIIGYKFMRPGGTREWLVRNPYSLWPLKYRWLITNPDYLCEMNSTEARFLMDGSRRSRIDPAKYKKVEVRMPWMTYWCNYEWHGPQGNSIFQKALIVDAVPIGSTVIGLLEIKNTAYSKETKSAQYDDYLSRLLEQTKELFFEKTDIIFCSGCNRCGVEEKHTDTRNYPRITKETRVGFVGRERGRKRSELFSRIWEAMAKEVLLCAGCRKVNYAVGSNSTDIETMIRQIRIAHERKSQEARSFETACR